MFTFFSQTKQQLPVVSRAPNCSECGLAAACKHPMQESRGHSTSVICTARPIADRPSSLDLAISDDLSRALVRAGINWKHAKNIPASACPGESEVSWKHCQPLLIDRIRQANPEKILLASYDSLQSVIGWLWKHPSEEHNRWYGQFIPSRELNAWVVPMGRRRYRSNRQVADTWLYRHLRKFAKLRGRPYINVPSYLDQVRLLPNPQDVVASIETCLNEAVMTAFDYETTGLKPESWGHEIVTASIAWLNKAGKTDCVAFPVRSNRTVMEALVKYLQSPLKKIAANAKFEERWSRRILGTKVANWAWDTVIAAHMDDPFHNLTGLKFQAFAKLGLPFYADKVERFFEAPDSNSINRIHEANLTELLTYNGVDAIAELDLGILQRFEAKIDTLWSPNLPEKRFYETIQ